MAGPAWTPLFRSLRASVSRWGRMSPLGPDASVGPDHPWRCPRRAALRLRWRGGPGLREERRQRGLEDTGSGSPGRLAWVGLSPSRNWDSRVLVQVDPEQAQDQVPLLPPRSAQRPAGALSRFTSSSFRVISSPRKQG
ncbi:uncharacterized protein LOC117091443 [Trachypithecus francoisi]|uniref:uncharacterized protein LOC117091443 n=1 Tax=Trachypithecus francoisi TaxID=54180 RepID=UPI00141B0390|nr:uncharacterized protein LOC117091443 [Trachypithecus francoisi]